MFSYYGSKTNIAHLYPKPRYNKIEEPFAGAAKYSLLHFENDVLLVDKSDMIIRIWVWLQQCSEQDILKLPRPKAGETLNDFNFDCIEAKWFMGFVVQFGVATPGLTPSATKINPGSHSRGNFINYTLKRVASDLFKIRHWKFIIGEYTICGKTPCTLFIDPPYQFGGHKYIHGNKKINYIDLGNWVIELDGQVICCENNKANWLPFKPMVRCQGTKKVQNEVIWTNEWSIYDNEQHALILQ